MNIPENTGVTQLVGVLLLAKKTKGSATKAPSSFVQVLYTFDDSGIEGKRHLINAWHPANFEECEKLIDKPVTFPAVRGFGEELYRTEKHTTFSPLKG